MGAQSIVLNSSEGALPGMQFSPDRPATGWEACATRNPQCSAYPKTPGGAGILPVGMFHESLTGWEAWRHPAIPNILHIQKPYGLLPATAWDHTALRPAPSIIKAEQSVENIAPILKELVQTRTVSVSTCDSILADLVERKDFILSAKRPQNWMTLRTYRFP